jgi:hypothetical protein
MKREIEFVLISTFESPGVDDLKREDELLVRQLCDESMRDPSGTRQRGAGFQRAVVLISENSERERAFAGELFDVV